MYFVILLNFKSRVCQTDCTGPRTCMWWVDLCCHPSYVDQGEDQDMGRKPLERIPATLLHADVVRIC